MFGILALHLYPQLPNNILSNTLRSKYGNLVAFCDRMQHISAPGAFVLPSQSGLYSTWRQIRHEIVQRRKNASKEQQEMMEQAAAVLVGVSVFAGWVMWHTKIGQINLSD